MRVSIFGLGYVGVVTLACLARGGHDVIGVDVNPDKVEMVLAGRSPIIEPGLADLLREGVEGDRVRATTDATFAIAESDVSLIAVGTPSSDRGAMFLGHVHRVSREIGDAIAAKGVPHVLVLRSTVPPGTLADCAEIVTEHARGVDVAFAFNPEFLREGSAIADFDRPSLTIIGTTSERAEQAVRGLYSAVDAPVVIVAPEVSEMVKYVANCWHAAKIGFANEIGRAAKAFGVDGRLVMDIITRDTKLNVSPVYMKPGFAYGGSCLPKDGRALLFYGQEMGVELPILAALAPSNDAQIGAAADLVLAARPKRVAVFGLAFKANTDDLRESPAVPLVKRLLGEGCEIRIYAPDVNEARLMGTNLEYIREHIPHFERLLVDDGDDTAAWADTVVVTHPQEQFTRALDTAPAGRRVIDLAGVFAERPERFEYDGIAW
jgi:GDP-mannose 6-dehydrogenase